MTPTELALAEERLLARCDWPVATSHRGGWRCTERALHDHEHRLTLGGRTVARSAGYTDTA